MRSGRYGEGLEILYSANSFFICDRALFNTISSQHETPEHSLIPPSSLRRIKFPKSRCNLKLFSRTPAVQVYVRNSLSEYTRLLSKAVSGLTNSSISFQGPIYQQYIPPDAVMGEIKNFLIKPPSHLLTEAFRPREYTVALRVISSNH